MTDWSAYPVGTRVRCADPDEFYNDTARKLRNREGIVVKHQVFSGTPVVLFAKYRNRKEFRWIVPDPCHLEIVT